MLWSLQKTGQKAPVIDTGDEWPFLVGDRGSGENC